MTKQALLELLEGIKQAVLFGYTLCGYVRAEQRHPHIAALCRQNGGRFDIVDKSGKRVEYRSHLANLISDPADLRAVEGNFLLLLDFCLIRQTHEAIAMYCKQSGQFADYKAAGDLFQFARICRNLTSHNDGATLNKWPPDLAQQGITSVTWKWKTLKQSDVGKHVHLDSVETFLLVSDLRSFVETTLH